MEIEQIVLGALVVITLYVIWARKNARTIGGGGKGKDSSTGWNVCIGIQDKPEFVDISSGNVYKMKKYKIITQVPLVMRVVLETNPDIGGGLSPEELDFYFEEGVNEPIPQNNISCSVPNKPGRWWFSQTGNLPQVDEVGKAYIEEQNRKIQKLESERRREKGERKAAVNDRMSVYSRWFGNKGGGYPPMGGGY